MAPRGSETFEKPVEKVEKGKNDNKMLEIQKAKEISKKKENLKDEPIVKEMKKQGDKTDIGVEMQKELAESKKMDDAVYKPEEKIETEGDYKQSEGIEQAFVKAVDKPSGVVEAEIKPDTTTGEGTQPQMETYEVISAQPVVESAPSPSIEAQPEVAQDVWDADNLMKEAVASSVADDGPAFEAVKPDEGVELKQPVMEDSYEQAVLDARGGEIGDMGDIKTQEDLFGEALIDIPGIENNIPDVGVDIGDHPPIDGGGLDDLESLTSITEDDLELGDIGLPDMDTSLPLDKQEDLPSGPISGSDLLSNQDGSSEPEPKTDIDGTSGTGTGTGGTSGTGSGTGSTSGTGSGTGSTSGTGSGTGSTSGTGSGTSGTSGTSSEKNEPLELDAIVGGPPPEPPSTWDKVESVAGKYWKQVNEILGTDPYADDKPIQGGGGTRAYEDPDAGGGGYEPSEPGSIPDVEGNEQVEPQVTPDTMSQPPVIDEWGTGIGEHSEINFEEVWGVGGEETPHTAEPEPEEEDVDYSELKPVDWTLVDPLDPDDDPGIELDDNE